MNQEHEDPPETCKLCKITMEKIFIDMWLYSSGAVKMREDLHLDRVNPIKLLGCMDE